eukprot:CAMPEP_0173386274 /NCGR_PEP_ID=MMETSP1356-20130122/8879_1 /TAXON_ID=77927 ORGANISM="Hemiselmis virescens, Strain PCC157" /NCGR_SAMPLE_ID=MMETSP1356 /ASSEMBLY_ACC=CAM_ASM_000847 /LENGTH=48 /DNA_ID= /DNA_START= /DNA_END= /DNA_ORIENTATION=
MSGLLAETGFPPVSPVVDGAIWGGADLAGADPEGILSDPQSARGWASH